MGYLAPSREAPGRFCIGSAQSSEIAPGCSLVTHLVVDRNTGVPRLSRCSGDTCDRALTPLQPGRETCYLACEDRFRLRERIAATHKRALGSGAEIVDGMKLDTRQAGG